MKATDIQNRKKLFEEKTKISRTDNGMYTISCNAGLWSVNAPSKEKAVFEAMRYFINCLSAGEYNEDRLNWLAGYMYIYNSNKGKQDQQKAGKANEKNKPERT